MCIKLILTFQFFIILISVLTYIFNGILLPKSYVQNNVENLTFQICFSAAYSKKKVDTYLSIIHFQFKLDACVIGKESFKIKQRTYVYTIH